MKGKIVTLVVSILGVLVMFLTLGHTLGYFKTKVSPNQIWVKTIVDKGDPFAIPLILTNRVLEVKRGHVLFRVENYKYLGERSCKISTFKWESVLVEEAK